MPFVDIRLAGPATREQKAGIVADVTRSLVERLGKAPGAVQVNITELSLENYGAGGILIADRPAVSPAPAVSPVSAAAAPVAPAPISSSPREDANAAGTPR